MLPNTLLLMLLLMSVPTRQGHTYAYVTNWFSHTISEYRQRADGTLVPLGPAVLPPGYMPAGFNAPGRVVTTPDSRFAYVLCMGTGRILTYRIAPNGSLVLMPRHERPRQPAWNPGDAVISPDGHFLYVTQPAQHRVAEYRIAPTGMLTPLSPPTAAAGVGAGAIALSADGKFAYVANNSSTISEYRIGPHGQLRPLPVRTVYCPDATSLACSPAGCLYAAVYVVWQFHIGPDGMLTPLAPSVPAGSVPHFHPIREIVLSPDFRSAYTVNTGHATHSPYINKTTISTFRISPQGSLRALPGPSLPTGGDVTALTFSPHGRFAFAVNGINTDSPNKNSIRVYRVGKAGAWMRLPFPDTPAGINPISIALARR